MWNPYSFLSLMTMTTCCHQRCDGVWSLLALEALVAAFILINYEVSLCFQLVLDVKKQ